MSKVVYFHVYQRQTDNTAVYPGKGTGGKEAITYCALKLAGEAGEVAEKVGKILYRGDVTSAPLQEILAKELGDVLWYVARLCTELNISLTDVASQNLEKLADRAERGVIKGSGDNR